MDKGIHPSSSESGSAVSTSNPEGTPSASVAPKPDEEKFVEFHYAEVKDLGKHFLTLISGTIVFSITFADKIINFANASTLERGFLVAAYISFIVALVLCGTGLFGMYLAAETAMGSLIYDYQSDYRTIARRSYAFVDLAALLYGIGLLLLVLVGIRKAL